MPVSSKPHPTKMLTPLAVVLRRRHHRRWFVLWGMILGVAALVLADHYGLFVYPGSMFSQFDDRWFAVDRVVDGDTLDIVLPGDGQTMRLRLWGIDTPEIANKIKGTDNQPWAVEASNWTREYCDGHKVRLKLQPQRIYGTYGRLLCYVYLEDGTMLNEQLLLAGLAKTDGRFVHQHLQRFEMLEQQAQFNRVGMWAGKESNGGDP